MGQSVLTPKEVLLGKAAEPVVARGNFSYDWSHSLGSGGKGIRAKIPKPACGEQGFGLTLHLP